MNSMHKRKQKNRHDAKLSKRFENLLAKSNLPTDVADSGRCNFQIGGYVFKIDTLYYFWATKE